MRVPSVKTLEAAFPGKGKVLRNLLTNSAAVRAHPAAIALSRACLHPPRLSHMRMAALDAECGTFGIEYVAPGSNRRSPGFSYLNAGDTYATTIIRKDNGTYIVGCWGDIVERGNYT